MADFNLFPAMFLRAIEIDDQSMVTDIVTRDYRTSAVFSKYGIDFCCGGKVPLQLACEINGVDKEDLKKELLESVRNIHISNAIDFNSWNIDFLVDYIRNIHHSYLQKNLSGIYEILDRFVEGHKKKYTAMPRLLASFKNLRKVILPHLEHEEQVIFPYIKQIAHAYQSREPYAALLVRTLRKPVEEMMHKEHGEVKEYLDLARELTNKYTPPPHACLTHRVCFAKLHELDNDLVQHMHLESNILFPRAISMEKELLHGE